MAESELVPQFNGINDIAAYAQKMTDADEAAEFIKHEASKLPTPITADQLNRLIDAICDTIKDKSEKTEEDYLESLQKTIVFDTKTRLHDAKKFIKERMMDERQDIVDAFIDNQIKDF